MKIASCSQVHKYITRHSTLGETPEGKLLISMISVAWKDACQVITIRKKEGLKKEWAHPDARSFFTDGRGSRFADLVGFQGDIVDLFHNHCRQRLEATV